MSKRIYILLIFITLSFLLYGCWNYRDINNLAIVSGVAIDKKDDHSYHLTAEIVDVGGGGKDNKLISKRVEAEGFTIFEAIRNMIRISGKRLFWSHLRIIVVSQEVAKDGIQPILDFISRNDELRISSNILISLEPTAKEILSYKNITSEISSYELEYMLNENKSNTAINKVEVYKFMKTLQADGKTGTIPNVRLEKNDDYLTTKIDGTSIFKNDKIIGTLDSKDTEKFLFITDQITRGVYIVQVSNDQGLSNHITLEIIETKTQIKPIYKNGVFSFEIVIKPVVAIASHGVDKNFLDKEGRNKLKKIAEEQLKTQIEKTIKKVQTELGVDIFNFSTQIKANYPNEWKNIEKNWEEYYKNIKTNVKVEMNISHSSLSSKSVKGND